MLNAPHNLRHAAVFVGAYPCGLALHAYELCAACRAVAHKPYRRVAGDTLGELYTGDFWDDLAAFFHVEHIVLVDVEGAHDILVVHGGTFYDSAREQHRLQIGNGGDDTHAADVERHEAQARQRTLGGEFICHGPARRLGGEAEVELLLQGVDLEHEAVGGYGQFLACLVPVVYEAVNLFNRLKARHGVRHFEAP